MSSILNGTMTGQGANGITAAELAVSGQRILARCMPGWIGVQVGWMYAAEKAIQFIQEAKRAQPDLSASAFAKIVYEMVGNGTDFDAQAAEITVAYIAVGRAWTGLVSEEVRTDAQKYEDAAVAWFQKKMAIPQPKPVPADPKADVREEASHAEWGSGRPVQLDERSMGDKSGSFIYTGAKRIPRGMETGTLDPAQARPAPKGLSNGFRMAILARAEDLERKAAGLRLLAQTVNAEYDEALWDLFGEILTKGGS